MHCTEQPDSTCERSQIITTESANHTYTHLNAAHEEIFGGCYSVVRY